MARIRPIPVGDATDLGAATSSTLKGAGFDMGPGNPSVPPAGSPEAQAFRTSQQPTMGPPEPAGLRGVPPPVNGMGYDPNAGAFKAGQAAANGVGNAAKVVGPAIQRAGVATAKGIVSNANPILNAVGQTAGHGDIYFDSKVPVMDRIRVGASDALGVIGGTAGGLFGAGAGSVVAPVAGTVAGGLAGSIAGMKGASWLGNKIFGSDDVMRRNGYDPERGIMDVAFDGVNGKSMFGGDQAAFNRAVVAPGAGPTAPPGGFAPAAPTTLAHPAAPGVVPSTGLGPAPTTSTGPGPAPVTSTGPGPGPAPVTSTGSLVSRQGNSFNGNNIREGFRYEDGPGSRPSTGSVSVLPGGAGGFGPSSGADAQLAAAQSAAADRGDFSFMGGSHPGASPGLSVIGSTPNNGLSVSIRDMMRTGLSARQAQQALTAADDRAERRHATDLGAGVAVHGQDVGAATTTRGQDIGAATTIRGQDFGLLGHKMTNDVARANMRREQFNADRTFDAGRADASFTQGQQAIKDLHEQIAGWIPPIMQDGKAVPDTQTAARYAAGVQAVVGRMGKTMKDMNETDKARIVSGMQLTDIANATATGNMTPWGTRAVQSNEPILALRKLSNGDYQTNRVGVNGETEVIPGRYIEKEGSTMGMGGRATNRFANLIEQGAKK